MEAPCSDSHQEDPSYNSVGDELSRGKAECRHAVALKIGRGEHEQADVSTFTF